MREVDETLPGEDLIREGFSDLAKGRESVPALLVLIGGPRLRRLGFEVPDSPDFPEDFLYARFAQEYGNDAHSKYNALIRRLVGFESAAARQRP